MFNPLISQAHILEIKAFVFLRVVFKPGMMSALFDNNDAHRFQNYVVDPRLFLDVIKELYERMQEEACCFARIKLLDAYLLGKLKWKTLPKSIYTAVTSTACMRGGGPVSVESVAREIGLSRQHLNRVTKQRLGYSAKQMLKVFRFNRTVIRFHSSPVTSLSQTAAELGYVDQSHMTHEFKLYSASTPRAYLRKLSKQLVFGPVQEFGQSGIVLE